MSDYIKREDAIKAIARYLSPVFERAEEGATRVLSDIPSADVVEVRHGKWMKAADDGVWSYTDAYAECDQCHKVTFNGWNMNFCPNCGTKMDGKEQEKE